jgi:hypothetical protein
LDASAPGGASGGGLRKTQKKPARVGGTGFLAKRERRAY